MVPIYNGKRFLERTLRSLLEQTAPADKIICIDDCSTDGSRSVIADLANPAITLIENETRLGLARNWNRALELAADYDFLTIAHQDDLYEPDYLRLVTDALQSHPSAFIAHTRALVIDEEDEPLRLASARYKEKFWPSGQGIVERPPEEELAILVRGDYIFCPSVTFRSAALEAIGQFDERFEFVPDWDFWLRGLLAGFTIVGVKQTLIRYRSHQGSATAAAELTFRRYQEEYAIVQRYSDVAASQGLSIGSVNTAAENSLADGIVRLLKDGDRAGAHRLLRYGNERGPGFRTSLPGRVVNLAVPLGRAGGMLVHFGIRLYMMATRRPRY